MFRKIRFIIIFVFAITLFYCLYRVVMIMNEYHRNDVMYEDLKNEVFQVSKKSDEINVDFETVIIKNQETVAWLWIPDTNINFPIVQGNDNEKYLHYAFDGAKSAVGSIFLDYRNSPEFSDRHSVIYGHNMKNGSMFGHLSKFSEREYTEKHCYIYLITEKKIKKYRIFSQYITNENLESYRMNFENEVDFEKYLQRVEEYSDYNTNWKIESKKIITLSTCVNDDSKRRVIHAVFIGESEVK